MKYYNTEQELVNHGLELTASLPDIMPNQALDQVKPIYADIKKTLRVPFVNLLFRTLANFPDYLEQAWQQHSPAFKTKNFEQLADTLRIHAVPDLQPAITRSDWEKFEGMDRIRAFNDTIYYVLPKLLLIATAFYETTFGTRTQVGSAPGDDDNDEIKDGIAEGTENPDLVDPQKAEGKIKGLFDSIKRRHGHPFVSSYYRGLANWPGFLEKIWDPIGAVVDSPAYEVQKRKLIEVAQEGVYQMPVTKIQNPALNSDQYSVVYAVLSAFRLKFLPEMLLDVAMAKVLLDGRGAAHHSRFSVADK